ncbi:MAG: DNA helicase-2/ATP-dependent DNA helicase PcrA [Verrucomicrobiales bacterium]|jgi:DNA helicase-2/ATP-dependent DNA helicase PcrA
MARDYQLQSNRSDGRQIDFKGELNAQQYAAVTSPPGKALVIAGAGSGKTRTLTYRVAYLLENDIAPGNILLLTFTNKAAHEMRQRVEDLLPGRTSGLWGGTFHSICNRILRRHADLRGMSRSYSILDSDDQKSLIGKIIKESKVDQWLTEQGFRGKFPKAQVVLGILSLATNTDRSVEDIIATHHPFFDSPEMVQAINRIAKEYLKRKRAANSVDFDDLMTECRDLLLENDSVRATYQHQFQFVLVDEFQDTNAVQNQLIDVFTGKHGNIMVVGDDAQSIYSWRGADFEMILGFPKTHKDAKVFKIETNYRSVPEVLELANQVIEKNTRQFRKELSAARDGQGDLPARVELDNARAQASFITQRVRELTDNDGLEFKDIAILYRSHFHSMELQQQFVREGIPHQVVSGVRFFEQAHIKDILCCLRFALNTHDEPAFDRMVGMLPGIGPVSANKLFLAWKQSPAGESGETPEKFSTTLLKFKVPAKAQADWKQLAYVLDEFISDNGKPVPPSAMIVSVLEGFYREYAYANFDNAEVRTQDIDRFEEFALEFESLEQFLSELSLLSSADGTNSGKKEKEKRDRDEDAVMLSTVHQAKGLEWKVVFLIGLTEGAFPNYRAIEEGGVEALEEERRLFYVAVTRAQDQLYLTFPQYTSRGGGSFEEPSSFLADFDSDLAEDWNVSASMWGDF